MSRGFRVLPLRKEVVKFVLSPCKIPVNFLLHSPLFQKTFGGRDVPYPHAAKEEKEEKLKAHLKAYQNPVNPQLR